MIRYTTTRPESADENASLIRDVFTELADTQPEGFHYAAFRLDDGVSFVHVVTLDGEENPLTTSAAFAAFQSGIGARVADGPVATGATVVGSYRLLPEEVG
jgi:hypothetical protein